VPPSIEWVRELHGFAWLRHLRAASQPAARKAAVELVSDWIAGGKWTHDVAWEPQVVGRRLISWIANAALLLEDLDQDTYDRTVDSIDEQLVQLSATWRDAPSGPPRMLALTALMYGDVCVAGRDRQLQETEQNFAAEIAAQILPDGGHVSRNPGVLVELLLDFLPLRQCFAARGRPSRSALDAAVSRMIPMLRFMRLGDGTLGRFNGMGAPAADALATVIAYADESATELGEAPQSHYFRLQRGDLIVLVDAGAPPPLEFAGEAHAGCLSFELSAGKQLIFVNGGAPGPADQDWRPASRATASHNTLCLGDKSSSRLVRHSLLESLIGAAPIRFPELVSSRHERLPEGDVFEASHDGYVAAFGVVHRRRLALAADGCSLDGLDSLGPPHGSLRLAQDVPFAIHFRLHPAVRCESISAVRTDLILTSGERWRFSAAGAQLSLEESVHCADLTGPRQSLQIVLRGSCFGDTQVRWRLEKAGS
jgi:uncharacterized heparinase superfamily protein